MNEAATTATWEVVKQFGFSPDSEVVSDVMPGLSFDFGDFKLSASCVLNERLQEVVLFTGVLVSSRTASEVCFQLPRKVPSPAVCAAWIVWNLDQHADGAFEGTGEVEWLTVGRKNQNLLPWKQTR